MDDDRLPPRATTYNGIPMRSRFEARVAAWLDARGIQWSYEPMAFAGREGQYLPDFQLLGREVYLEVKGQLDQAGRVRAQNQMEVVLASQPGAYLLLASEEQLEAGMVDWTLADHPWVETPITELMGAFLGLDMPQWWRLPRWNE
jgi:hypothetical protein